jgi:hypothetical protein
MATTNVPPSPNSVAIASHKSVVKVAIPHCRGRWFPTTATRTGSDRIGIRCEVGFVPKTGGRESRNIMGFGCEFKEMFGADIAGS